MAESGIGAPARGAITDNSITELSNVPLEISNAESSDMLNIHVDNSANGDPTYIKLWTAATVTYASDEPAIKVKVPAGVIGELTMPYTAVIALAQKDGTAKWWIAASSSAAVNGAAPTNTVDLTITRTT